MKQPVFLLAVLILGLTLSVSAAQGEMTYIVHGIPGQDLGLGLDPELPVDVSVGGSCALEDFKFGDVVGPVPVNDPTLDVQIYLADDDGAPGCDGTLVLDLPGVPFGGGASTIVAHLTADGAAGAGDVLGIGITGSKFDLDLQRNGRGKGRLVAHHTAKAPTVDVDLWRGQRVRRVIEVEDFMPGDQAQADLRPGNWRTRLRVADTTDVAFGPTKVRIKPYQATVVFAVGTALTDSFDLIGFRTPTAFR
jgi:hypothetical protein